VSSIKYEYVFHLSLKLLLEIASSKYLVMQRKESRFSGKLMVKKAHVKTNSMASDRERTTLTERPPLVGEVIANF
jgi:hypothetical protein